MPANLMPLWMLAAAAVVTVVVPIVGGGGRLWFLPLFVWPILILAAVGDRYLRGRHPHDR